MKYQRPTHVMSSYYAPRGHNRMYALGMEIAQLYLNPNDKLIGMLPEELREEYRSLIVVPEESYEHVLIKAADKISAYIKCLEELRSGNREFAKAEATLAAEVERYRTYEEVAYFCDTFLDTFRKTLDELT